MPADFFLRAECVSGFMVCHRVRGRCGGRCCCHGNRSGYGRCHFLLSADAQAAWLRRGREGAKVRHGHSGSYGENSHSLHFAAVHCIHRHAACAVRGEWLWLLRSGRLCGGDKNRIHLYCAHDIHWKCRIHFYRAEHGRGKTGEGTQRLPGGVRHSRRFCPADMPYPAVL